MSTRIPPDIPMQDALSLTTKVARMTTEATVDAMRRIDVALSDFSPQERLHAALTYSMMNLGIRFSESEGYLQ